MVSIKLEDLKSWKRLSCIISLFGGLQFIVVTFIAMFFYPDGYSFTEDYFSHLGTTVNMKTGSPNDVSRFLFVMACVITGVCLIPFWIVLLTLFTASKLMKALSLFGSLLGVISCPFLMGIGIFAGDTQPSLHVLSTRMFFLLFAAAILIYSIAILFNAEYQNIYSIIGIAFSILIVLFVLRFFIQINVIMQKIIVYGFCSWALLQITKIWKYF
jgi:hypothetical membrane protein